MVIKSQESRVQDALARDGSNINGVMVEQFVSVGDAVTPTLDVNGRPHVVVIGAGFGGLSTVQALRNVDVDVTLVDRRNHHLFVPLLYQVATAQLSADHIAQPIRRILKKQDNAKVVYDEATDIDVDGKSVVLASGKTLTYDFLVIAVGAKDSYFGHDEWAKHAPGLKSLEDAERIRQQILLAFERAEKERDPVKRKALLTFVIVGGGPTGVEMAGAIAEIRNHTLQREFSNFNPRDARVVLLEGMPRVFPMFKEKLSARAQKDLEKLGVEVRTGSLVTDIDEQGVVIGGEERIETETIIWAAGIQAASLTSSLNDVTQLDRSKRVAVTRELTVPGHPEIFVIGDAAIIKSAEDKPWGAVAPVAIQSGKHAAKNIQRFMRGEAFTPFVYHDQGNMATIGRNHGVADIYNMQITGFAAWLLWALVHIMQLVTFRNRVAVAIQWAIDYFGYNRNARVILDHSGDTK
ncbi:MAG TPA: NAD(P)/FAD-dependent oxidoreductase [Thermomicrobiales bacterium]|nr:NAD(P)/FAD-dependent oxidoreductase [Thermomicrobiales bacterium]